MKLTRPLTALVFLAMLTHAADLAGEYCIDTSEKQREASETKKLSLQTGRVGVKEAMDITDGVAAAKECYQFQADNKIAYTEEVFGARRTFSGSYTQKGNSISIVIDKVDEKQFIAFSRKFYTKTTYEAFIHGKCSKVVNDYESIRWQYPNIKKYPKTQQGYNDCLKDVERELETVAIKAGIDNRKIDDGNIETEFSARSGNLSLAGNTLHKLDQNCKSKVAYVKKGSTASAFSFDGSKQFCLNSAAYDKCGGKTYDPIEQQCENNVLLSKCGNVLYNPAEQYCFKNVVRNKELTDSRDGKKYKVVKIGTQTWMGENLNYHGKDGYLGLCEYKKQENCEKYGRKYDWKEAMEGCPEGWSVPLYEDWKTLVEYVGGAEAAEKKLMEEVTDKWSLEKCKGETEDNRGRVTKFDNCPTNEYGFSASTIDPWWSASDAPETYGRGYARCFSPYNIEGISKREETHFVRCLQISTQAKAAAAAAERAFNQRKAALEASISKDADKKYTWAEAKKYCATKGWHLPTNDEWGKIEKFLNAGEEPIIKEFTHSGEEEGPWWSATEDENPGNKDYQAYAFNIKGLGSALKEEVLATRCVKGNLSVLPASLKTSAKASSNASSENYVDLSTWLSKNNVSWGLRLAYNGSTVIFEGLNYGLGHGAEAGLIVNIPIPNTAVEISLGANGVYRKPYTKEIIDVNSAYIKSELTEYVGSIPIMLKYNISNFYIQAGAQIDVPLKMEQKTTKGIEEIYEEVLWRTDRDLGVAFGLGFNINKNISLDIKAVGGVSEYNKEVGGYKLVQGSVGLSYLFPPSPAPTAVAPAPTAVAPAPMAVEPPAVPAKDPTEAAKEELEDK
ncbi:MAG: outer membrane beta-barrel protein [Fibromonadales bacterium]|nr:outer membrane beta-barrel protein [Fibromonadales bacterium]